ncbi:hypothetical protein GCM10008932_23690 [Alkalibacterium iburiense]|uniref:Uncharacterized protein n=1 Tax=Alkalibacterium iburiense TaxID=290589 RepID=A0ABN0XSE4_9LACT
MNKQSKLFGFLTFILLSFLGFGFYQTYAGDGRTDVAIITDEGDISHFDHVEFIGNVYSTSTYRNLNTFIHSSGHMRSLSDLSFLKQMDFEYNATANRVVENHRSFMRGKSRNSALLTETDEHLIYTGMAHDVDWTQYDANNLTVAVLDKESEEEKEFEVDLNNQTGETHSVNVVTSYVNYPELTIITSEHISGDYMDNYFVYTFNIEEPVETLEPILNLTAELDASESILNISSSASDTGRYIPIYMRDQPDLEYYDGGYTETEIPSGEHYVYDIQTNEVIDIPAFEDSQTIVLAEEDTVYVGKNLGDTIEIHEMHIETQELDRIGSLEMATPRIGRGDLYHHDPNSTNLHIIDGKLYAYENDYSNEVSRPLFQVIDLETQETLFTGFIDVKDSQDVRNYELLLNNYSIMNYQNE